ncbi:hypothetical protein, partial [Vreelandella arcis]|uniref:hypothetical protein n=1 Tax=Vreelandella arcis TaxID=416873 RepID=UPI001B8D3EE0
LGIVFLQELYDSIGVYHSLSSFSALPHEYPRLIFNMWREGSCYDGVAVRATRVATSFISSSLASANSGYVM